MKQKVLSRMAAGFFACLLMVMVGTVGQGWALPVLTISDGTNSVTVNDDNGDGIVAFMGTIGNWDFTISMASSFPAIGSLGLPEMHLTGSTTSLSGSGTLTFTVEDTFNAWNNNLDGLVSAFGGLAGSGATVEFKTYLDGMLLAGFGPESGAFSDSLVTMITPSDPGNYTLKIEGTITTTAAGQAASFDGGIAPVPEPATILLFGAGLIGIAGFARKKVLK